MKWWILTTGFPSIKAEENFAVTYGVSVQARNPSPSVLGVQLDDKGEELRKRLEDSGRGAGFPHPASHWLCLIVFGSSGYLLGGFKSTPELARDTGERGHVPFLQSCAVLPTQGTFQKQKQMARSCSLSTDRAHGAQLSDRRHPNPDYLMPQSSALHLQTPPGISFFFCHLLPSISQPQGSIPGQLQQPAVSFQD